MNKRSARTLSVSQRQTCAIYTRKSSEEGLEQSFNSLDAQREACAAYIQSQVAQGWIASPQHYDDGGFSGGNMERAGLQRLLQDIQQGKVQIVVVYKVDRLTRSLADFAKLVELFDLHGVSFVSVTQQFNTTSSMGRLTLNVLLSFAQFEREVTGERIRDKIAASKRKGMWMGGPIPIGYLPQERSLAIDVEQAIRVRHIFSLYLDLGCVSKLKAEIDRKGWLTPVRSTQRADAKGNRPFSRGHLYRILGNPIYIGQVRHKNETFPGNHPALIDQDTWEVVQAQLQANRQRTKGKASALNPSPLAGLVYDAQGQRFTPTHAKKGTKRYRYYIQTTEEGSQDTQLTPATPTTPMRIPAQELEAAVAQGIQDFLQDPQRLLEWCNEQGLTKSHTIEAVLHRARTTAQALQQHPKQQLPQLLERVIAEPHQIDIALKRQVLMGAEGAKEEEREASEETTTTADIGLTIPVELRRRGLALKLVVGKTHSAQTADPRIIALLVKAHDWWGRLTSGISRGVGEIAQQESVTSSYVTRVINLVFIAPDIVQRLACGNYPLEITADKLIRMVPLPADWQAQRRLFRMSD